MTINNAISVRIALENTRAVSPKAFPFRVRLTPILLYTYCLSLNAIAKLIGASTPAVLKWEKQFVKEQCEMPTLGESVIVELDEMGHDIER